MKQLTLGFMLCITMLISNSQEKEVSYYSTIPEYPALYSPGTVAARMVDGLGFRYYWATENLRAEDLIFRPNEEARTTEETLDHILGLSQVILNASLKKVHESIDIEGMSFEEKRAITLQNIRKAADIFRKANNDEMSEFEMVFQGDGQTTNYPLWNLINGPIADAIWHVGQVVSFRRSSGNPFNSNVSVLRGKLRE